MDWLHAASYLSGGAFPANAVPHFVNVLRRFANCVVALGPSLVGS